MVFHTNAPYLILYQLTKFQCHIFSTSENIKQNVYQLTKFQCHIFSTSQDIKQNVLLSSYLDN